MWSQTRLLPLLLVFGLLLSVQTVCASETAVFKAVPGNPPAPSLKLMTIDGKEINLENLRGKVVLVNFWATWCIPCRREMPSLQRLWLQLEKSPLQILAVDVGEDAAAINSFMGAIEISPTFPILLDTDSAALQTWPVKVLPTSFLVDKQGRMAYQVIGGLEFDSPESLRLITELLARDK